MVNFANIETKRLLLTGLSHLDMQHIFQNFQKPEIKRILGHRSEEEYLKEESKQLNGYSSYNRRFIMFLLTDRSSNQIIGRCGLHNWNEEHKRAEMGYIMEDERFRRKGLMTEAVGAVINYGFNQLDLNRIEALVGSGNVPSLKLMEKYQFVREGVLKQHYSVDDGYEDSVMFAKLRYEYFGD